MSDNLARAFPASAPQVALPDNWTRKALISEQALLGVVLLDGGLFDDMETRVEVAALYFKSSQLIWGAMKAMRVQPEPLAIDVSTVAEWLEQAGELNDVHEVVWRDGQSAEIRGLAYLAYLVKSVEHLENAEAYLKPVLRVAFLRNLLSAARGVEQLVLTARPETSEMRISDEAEKLILQATAPTLGRQIQIMSDALDEYDANQRAREGALFVPTGILAVDDFMTGLEADQLNLIGGAPGHGKTAALVQIAVSAARHGIPTLFSSQEMTRDAIIERILSQLSHVPALTIRVGVLNEEEADYVADARAKLKSLPLFIDDTRGISVAQMRTKARRIWHDYGLGLLVQDYYDLITRPSMNNTGHEMRAMAEDLRALAEEFHMPVLAGGQINEQRLQARQDKRPTSTDLRNGAAPYEVAGVVIWLYRGILVGDSVPKADEAEWIIAKRRFGPANHTIYLKFRGSYTLFVDPKDVAF